MSLIRTTSLSSTQIPRQHTLGSDDWKIAQLAQKRSDAQASGTPLSSAQIKRFKATINKAAQSFNDKRLLEKKRLNDAYVTKQIRKDNKKKRQAMLKQTKHEEALTQLRIEADTLFSQCEKLNLGVKQLFDDTHTIIIQKCQQALTQYHSSPLSKNDIKICEQAHSRQINNIAAEARASEIFRDAKTGHIVADQSVPGEDYSLPKKKKKSNKKKYITSIITNNDTPDITIDWGNSQLSQKLTKKQQRQIATANTTPIGA
jgi:hypothetical protein